MKLRRFTKAIGDTVMSSAFKERRRTPRWPVGRIAMILSEVGAAPRYCLVIDQSDGGVRIRTTPDFEVPSEFTLHCGDTQTTYTPVWRNGRVLGAQVVGRARRSA